jgi:hypothetical protein
MRFATHVSFNSHHTKNSQQISVTIHKKETTNNSTVHLALVSGVVSPLLCPTAPALKSESHVLHLCPVAPTLGRRVFRARARRAPRQGHRRCRALGARAQGRGRRRAASRRAIGSPLKCGCLGLGGWGSDLVPGGVFNRD